MVKPLTQNGVALFSTAREIEDNLSETEKTKLLTAYYAYKHVPYDKNLNDTHAVGLLDIGGHAGVPYFMYSENLRPNVKSMDKISALVKSSVIENVANILKEEYPDAEPETVEAFKDELYRILIREDAKNIFTTAKYTSPMYDTDPNVIVANRAHDVSPYSTPLGSLYTSAVTAFDSRFYLTNQENDMFSGLAAKAVGVGELSPTVARSLYELINSQSASRSDHLDEFLNKYNNPDKIYDMERHLRGIMNLVLVYIITEEVQLPTRKALHDSIISMYKIFRGLPGSDMIEDPNTANIVDEDNLVLLKAQQELYKQVHDTFGKILDGKFMTKRLNEILSDLPAYEDKILDFVNVPAKPAIWEEKTDDEGKEMTVDSESLFTTPEYVNHNGLKAFKSRYKKLGLSPVLLENMYHTLSSTDDGKIVITMGDLLGKSNTVFDKEILMGYAFLADSEGESLEDILDLFKDYLTPYEESTLSNTINTVYNKRTYSKRDCIGFARSILSSPNFSDPSSDNYIKVYGEVDDDAAEEFLELINSPSLAMGAEVEDGYSRAAERFKKLIHLHDKYKVSFKGVCGLLEQYAKYMEDQDEKVVYATYYTDYTLVDAVSYSAHITKNGNNSFIVHAFVEKKNDVALSDRELLYKVPIIINKRNLEDTPWIKDQAMSIIDKTFVGTYFNAETKEFEDHLTDDMLTAYVYSQYTVGDIEPLAATDTDSTSRLNIKYQDTSESDSEGAVKYRKLFDLYNTLIWAPYRVTALTSLNKYKDTFSEYKAQRSISVNSRRGRHGANIPIEVFSLTDIVNQDSKTTDRVGLWQLAGKNFTNTPFYGNRRVHAMNTTAGVFEDPMASDSDVNLNYSKAKHTDSALEVNIATTANPILKSALDNLVNKLHQADIFTLIKDDKEFTDKSETERAYRFDRDGKYSKDEKYDWTMKKLASTEYKKSLSAEQKAAKEYPVRLYLASAIEEFAFNRAILLHD